MRINLCFLYEHRKICIFTDAGKMHTVKVADIPLVRFRDKGVPADNLSNYSSSQEQILLVASVEEIKKQKLLFVTASSMCKLVKGEEFDVTKSAPLRLPGFLRRHAGVRGCGG